MPRAIKATKPGDELPALPTTVFSIVGPVPVVLVADLKTQGGDHALGLWVPEERTIKLHRDVALITQWITLYHEMVHVACWDAGANLDEQVEERVADALSSFLFAAGVRLTEHGL